jgi:hypothetical protein
MTTHHEVGIGDVVFDHASTQDDHPRALGKNGLCVDEPQVWEEEEEGWAQALGSAGPLPPLPGVNASPSTMSKTSPGFL